MPRSATRRGAGSAHKAPPPFMLEDPRYSQSVERGLAILATFEAPHPDLGIADIADALGLSRSTTHRYVSTLLALGYLEQQSDRKYRLSVRVSDLGMAALNATGLREHAHPVLEELRRQLSCHAAMAVLDGIEIVYVDRVRSFKRGYFQVETGLQPGSRLPAYCTAMGKLLLAHLPEAERNQALVEMRLSRHGPNTITRKSELRAQLERVLDAGIAVDNEEMTPGLVAIAAPVRDGSSSLVAAIDLSTRSSMIRAQDLADVLGPRLLIAAKRISVELGYRGDEPH